MELRQQVGLNIQNLRQQQELSQEELADRAAIHTTYLSGLENGRRNPSLLVLGRIAAALKVEVEDLVRRRGSIAPKTRR